MAIFTPPSPPLLTTGGTTDTTVSPPHLSTSSTSLSIIIVIIVIASAIILSAAIYLLLRFISRRCSSRNTSIGSVSDLSPNNVVSGNQNHNHDHNHQHVICFDNNSNSKRKAESSLPLFTFSSLTGNIAGGDCAVCLSKFEAADQLRLLPLCCHAFHVECIDAWLQSNQTCPLCRSTVNPTEADVLDKILSISDNRNRNNNNNSFRIEIGSVSSRQPSINSTSGQRSYSLGSYEYVLDEGVEVPVESTHRTEISIDKDLPMQENLAGEIGGSGRFNWLRDYVDRVSVSISSRSQSFRGNSGRFFTGSSRRSEVVDDFEATHGRVGEEISELFRWLSGV